MDGIKWSQFGITIARYNFEFVGLDPVSGDNVRLQASNVMPDTVLTPAQSMALGSGSPVVAFTGSGSAHYWSLDPAGAESVGMRPVIPSHWQTYNITARVLNTTAVAGNAVLRADVGTLAVGSIPVVSNGVNVTAVLPATQFQIVEVTLRTAISLTADRRIGVVINRFGADGLDTLAGDMGLLDVSLVRVT
jgi:hypothetical protein